MIGTNVTISGVPIGSVAKIELVENKKGKVLVTLDLQSGTQVPKNAVAAILSTGFMGGKVVKLIFDEPCTNNCAQSGDYLQGKMFGMVTSMLGEDGLAQMMDEVKDGFGAIIDTLNDKVLNEDSNTPIAMAIKDLRQTLGNLQSASLQLDVVVRRSSGKIDGTLDNLYSLTGSIEQKSDQIGQVIDNASTLSNQLVKADLQKTMGEVNESIASLQTTLNETSKAVDGINQLVGQIQDGEGSLGKLVNDEELYENLSSLSHQFDSLATDLQDRPYRYIP